MKITELCKVPESRIGKLNKNGIVLEPHEEDTAKYLVLFGFNIEAIRPTNTPKMKNSDFLINGAIHETKSPTSSNPKTIKKRMHEASEQATRIIVDLRRIRRDYGKTENEIIRRFRNKNTFRVMILIRKDGTVLEYRK